VEWTRGLSHRVSSSHEFQRQHHEGYARGMIPLLPTGVHLGILG
jgi:hypothetical protein